MTEPEAPESPPPAPGPEPETAAETEAAPSPAAAAPESPAAAPPPPPAAAEPPAPQGIFGPLREVLLRPGPFFSRLGREGWAEPLAFGLVLGTIGLLAALYWQMLLWGLAGRTAGGGAFALVYGLEASVAVIMALAAPILVLLNLGLGSLCLWAGAVLAGAGPAGFTAALRITCYAQGAMVAALVPVLGGPLAGLWMLILTYKGVRGVFGASAGRAVLALVNATVLEALIMALFFGGLVLSGLVAFRS